MTFNPFGIEKLNSKNFFGICISPLDAAEGQGPDHGDSYRSIIFYQNEAEKIIAEKQIAELTDSKKYGRPIAVQVVPFEKFWMAEDYHQNYVRLHPSQSYVMHESIPRLKRTQAAVSELIKADRKM